MLARSYFLIYSTFNPARCQATLALEMHRESPGCWPTGPCRALGVGEAVSGDRP